MGLSLPGTAAGQQSYTWAQIKDKFQAVNPTVRAGLDSVAESKAQEITAFLRPNPGLTVSGDQIDPFPSTPYRPLASFLPTFSGNYLHERANKRELRLESAKKGTSIVISQQEDMVRTLLYTLRAAFVSALQAKAVRDVAKDNLAFYDRLLTVSRDRLQAGDIAQVDLMRLDLQRVQYEADLQTAEVNLRTAKIQLLQLLNDRTPVDQFDVDGPFDFSETVMQLAEVRNTALDARPDLRAAVEAIDKARTDHRLAVSNGSTDPTFSVDVGRQPPVPVYLGASISIPIRIFDRNQGEKERTEIDIRRTERLRDASVAQVYNDVDSAWEMLNSNLTLLRPYKAKYLDEATKVRDTITFAYQHGGASLLDFLSAENDYRAVRLSYLNLVASYLNSANQLNLAVGREVITQ